MNSTNIDLKARKLLVSLLFYGDIYALYKQTISVCETMSKYIYRILYNYRIYPYKRTVEKFRSLQITVSVLFLYFFIKAYVVGTHLNCIDLSMQFK